MHVNIEIMRAFVQLRAFPAEHEELRVKLAELERKYDSRFRAVFEAIRQLMESAAMQQRQSGFGTKEPDPKRKRPHAGPPEGRF